MDIQQLFSETARLQASDLHLMVGYPPIVRVSGKLGALPNFPILTVSDTDALVTGTLNPEQKEIFLANKELDFSLSSPLGRFRVNAYVQKSTIAAVFRLIPSKIKSLEELGVASICKEFVNLRQGLILVTGPTGHGKSTTIASMLQTINTTRSCHIVTVEDPIEYVYPQGMSLISQREMNADTHSWKIALRSVLREDPDVVLIGEMRDLETMSSALTIAETGHLVFATLHTNSASQSMDRIVDVFPENQQVQIRYQLSAVLEGIISQRLVPNLSGGRTAVSEILTATSAVRATIRDGKMHLLNTVIQTSVEQGMISLEMALAAAVKSGKIASDVALSYALHPEELNRLLLGA
ncbi:PilT/PilU family type 4a pilus ATPase [Candidatus Gottesmanbacteria bacterium]|nr:PilT/PilU family type 4a pilus ATPase [Candidatus Gottesmanbacteria bacterium]